MHTYKTDDNIIFHYNSDFSGDINIFNNFTDEDILIKGNSLIEFIVECYIRPALISKFEQIDFNKLLEK